MRRALFLDRDGVLNALVRRDGRWLSPLRIEDFAVLPGVARAVRALRRAGLVALVVTNQPELTRGRLRADELERMHEALGRAIVRIATPIIASAASRCRACCSPRRGTGA